jgi:hypothetical protein
MSRNQLSPASGFGFRCILLLGPNIGTPSLVYWEERNNTQHALIPLGKPWPLW